MAISVVIHDNVIVPFMEASVHVMFLFLYSLWRLQFEVEFEFSSVRVLILFSHISVTSAGWMVISECGGILTETLLYDI